MDGAGASEFRNKSHPGMLGQLSRAEVNRRLAELDQLEAMEKPARARARERHAEAERKAELTRLIEEQTKDQRLDLLRDVPPRRRNWRQKWGAPQSVEDAEKIAANVERNALLPQLDEGVGEEQLTGEAGAGMAGKSRARPGRPRRGQSEMRRQYGLLLAAMLGVETRDKPRLKRGEWSHNLAWAWRRLRGAGARWQSIIKAVGSPEQGAKWRQDWVRREARTLRRIYGLDREFTRGLPLCPGCRTPILVGCWLHGKKITRGREHCDDKNVCKMRAARWRGKGLRWTTG